MDIEDRKYSLAELEKYSYRVLQQIAKSLCLPSNVKKMYLIEMIHAKNFKSEEELKAIIKKVKLERLQASQEKKKESRKHTYLQGPEISSTSNSLSPPISMTPKRAGHIVIRCSPENIRQAIAKYKARQSNRTRNSTAIRKTYPSPKKSDRVLRSFNIKTKNNAKIIENTANTKFETVNLPKNSFGNINNSIFSILRPQNVVKETQEQRFPKMITDKCVVKRYKPVLNRHTFGLDPERSQLIPVTRNVGTTPMVPAKRQRILSGIYPLIPQEPPKISYEYVQSVGFRRQDGKISKINAVVQKRTKIPQIEVTVQDIINKSVTQTLSKPGYGNTETSTSLTYSNINMQNRAITDLKTERCGLNIDHSNDRYGNGDKRNETYGNIVKRNDKHCDTDSRMERYDNNRYELYGNIDNGNERHVNLDERNERYDGDMEGNDDHYSVYYHKKIRGEQVRSQRSYQREVSREEEQRLPKINDVFSRFNAHTDVTQPIYVQVSDESERLTRPVLPSVDSSQLLEQLYNFRSGFVVPQPLQQLPRASTSCVYSTPLIATAVAQPTALGPDYSATSACERDNYYSDLAGFPKICELLKFGEQENIRRDFRCDEELSSSSSLDESSQELGATVTIPEMVEDALELISQDGDYMERIGMDVRIQCVLCKFVCPRFLLEYHIRKEHSNEIHHRSHNTWTMSFSLGSLLQAASSTVLSHDDALYILTVDIHSDCLRGTVYSLVTDENFPKSGSITIYNKVTGEPYTWEGEIQTLPYDFAYNANTDGLNVQVSKLDLLPNSANLKLSNGKLVLKSPTKVVVGQPDLNDIHVILFIKIFN